MLMEMNPLRIIKTIQKQLHILYSTISTFLLVPAIPNLIIFISWEVEGIIASYLLLFYEFLLACKFLLILRQKVLRTVNNYNSANEENDAEHLRQKEISERIQEIFEILLGKVKSQMSFSRCDVLSVT